MLSLVLTPLINEIGSQICVSESPGIKLTIFKLTESVRQIIVSGEIDVPASAKKTLILS